MGLLCQPTEEPPHGNQAAIYRGDGLALVTAEVVLEVGQLVCGDTLDREWFPVGRGKPGRKLPQVIDHGSAAIRRQVVVLKILSGEGLLVLAGLRAKAVPVKA